MGCDIHLYLERRVEGKWQSADTWEQCEYDNERKAVPYQKQVYSGRNYRLFSLLADVRNYGEVRPFSEPRGLPEDASPEVRGEFEWWESNVHSGSYFTAAELMAFDWTIEIPMEGYIEAREYLMWSGSLREDGRNPREWCGGTSQETVSEDVAKARIAAMPQASYWEKLEALKSAGWAVHATWSRKAYDECSDFIAKVLPNLWRLGSPEDTRIVFWFDN